MIAGGLLLIALVLRLVWRRAVEPTAGDDVRVHPAAMLSYCGSLGIIVARRTDSLGTPADWWLLAGALVVAVGYVGVLQRVDLHTRLPWQRR